jgi:hypothetical protein
LSPVIFSSRIVCASSCQADHTKCAESIGAPITIDGKNYIAVAVVREGGTGNNRLYSLKEKLLKIDASKPVIQDANQEGEITKVLKNIVTTKFFQK